MKDQIQKLLGEEISLIKLKGQGACNNAYYVETQNHHKYIIKQERENKEFKPQNTLIVEANIIKQLANMKYSLLQISLRNLKI